jgi:hypothetical protein
MEADQQGSKKKELSVKQRGQIVVLFPIVLLAFMLVALFGPLNVHAASGARVRTISVPAHFTSLPRFVKNTTTQSSNWSGYATDSSTYTSVSSSWVEPSVSCSGTAYSSFWVGLDGYNSNSVEQTGTESDCSGSSPVYYAWYEMYPAYPVNFSNTVRPGDSISASVTASGSTFTLVVTDHTQGWSRTVRKTSSSAAKSSAEVIAEAPSSGSGVLPLADFHTANFSNSLVNGQAIGNLNPVEIVMASGGTVKAQPSGLSGGTAFSDTWKHS